MSEDIKKIREKIDSLDDDILDLFNQRAQQAVLIAQEKQKSKKLDNFYNPEREAQVIRRIPVSYTHLTLPTKRLV